MRSKHVLTGFGALKCVKKNSPLRGCKIIPVRTMVVRKTSPTAVKSKAAPTEKAPLGRVGSKYSNRHVMGEQM